MTIPIMNFQQHGRQVTPYAVRGCTDLTTVAATIGAAAVVSMAAPANDANGNKPDNTISQIYWSYAATPAGGRLTIADSSGTLYDQDLVGTKGVETFTPPFKASVQGSALTVTLAAGVTTGATAKCNVRGWVEL
jgi:hypothetical protein